jgi:hypothetical protein
MLRKNTPTVSELKSLYESELYQNLWSEFARRSNRELDNSEDDESALLEEMRWYQEEYSTLDASFEEILSEFTKSQDQFLNYVIALASFGGENHVELGFPNSPRLHKTYLLMCFGDFYMIKTAIRQKRQYHT